MPASPPFSSQTARRGLRRGLWTIAGIGVAIALGVLALSRTEVGATALAQLWQQAHTGRLLAAFGVMTLAFFFMGLRWRALMPRAPGAPLPPAGGLMAIICAGLLLNYALPGPLGELGAAWFASRRYGVPLAASLASGVAARLVGLAVAAVTAAGVWLVADLPVPPEYHRLVGAAVVLIGLGGAVLAALVARPGPWKRLGHVVLGPIAAGTTALAGPARQLEQGLAQTADSVASVARSRPGAWLRAVGWSLASHGSVVSGVALAASGFGAPTHVAGLLFTYATTTAGAVALFALPGSQLGWDAMFLTLLNTSAGLPLDVATAVAVVVRVHHLLVMVLGAVALAWLLREAVPSPTASDSPPPAEGPARD